MSILLHRTSSDKPEGALPPSFTLPHWINPQDRDSVRAFMESSLSAWREWVRQRRLNGCCEGCGHPIVNPAYGCENTAEDCLEALLAEQRREASRR